MMFLQTDFPTDSGIPRWGCFIVSVAYGAMASTGFDLTFREMLNLYADGLHTRLPWDPAKTVIALDGEGKLWCNDPTGWLQMILNRIEPGRWRGWQTGEDGKWFAGERWYNGPGPADWSFVLLNWQRPSGGHYTCLCGDKHMDPMDGRLKLIPRGSFRAFSVREAT